MAKFMLVLGGTDKGTSPTTLSPDQIMTKYQEWTTKLANSGALVYAHKLKDGEGRRFHLKRGTVVDGPYVETKESIGGFYILEVPDYAAANAYAKECPTLLYQGGYVEVRSVEI